MKNKHEKNRRIIQIIVFVVLILLILFIIDQKTGLLDVVKNRSTVFISNNLNSGSGSYAYSSGSGLQKANPSSGSGALDSGSIVLTKTYTGAKTNMYRVQLTNLNQLNVFYSKSSFSSSFNKVGFYNYAKLQISRGSKIDLYLDKTRVLNESVGMYDGYFINSKFIVKAPTCSFAASFSTANTVSVATSSVDNKPKTPILDSMGGICGPLSAAHSINSVLKLPPPNGMATSTIVNGKRVWNKEYLEWLMQGVEVGWGGGIRVTEYPEIYKKYLKNMKVVKPRRLDEWFSFRELMNLFYHQKADCSLFTSGHVSNISNIYEQDGKKYIEIINTLEQGDANNDNITTTPGKTTLVVEKDGSLTVEGHGGLSKEQIDYWSRAISVYQYRIICIYDVVTAPVTPAKPYL